MTENTALAIFIGAFVGVVMVFMFLMGVEHGKPRLVGYGCTDDGTGVLYADEESSFPACIHIERN